MGFYVKGIKMPEMSDKEYMDFMWDRENEYNCKECPENRNNSRRKYPCGQQNCWVVCHTKSQEDE